MNRFQIQGKLIRIDTFTTSSGKAIPSLIIETTDYKGNPQPVAIKALGRTGAIAQGMPVGGVVEVNGKMGGREYNGKVYVELLADSIEAMGGQHKTQKPPAVDDMGEPPF